MKISSRGLLLTLANLPLFNFAAASNSTRHAQLAKQFLGSQIRMASTHEDLAPSEKNVVETRLEQHGKPELPTGWFRDNYCRPDSSDPGDHTLAGIVTKDFLEFSKARGNDLMSSGPKLTEGCRWCLCVSRWKEALDAYKSGDQPKSVVPLVNLEGTSYMALRKTTLEELKEFREKK